MGTLVYDPFYHEIPAFFGLTHAELVALNHPTSWLEFERGEISQSEYLRRCFADERTFEHDVFLARVEASYRWIDGTETLLADLHNQNVEMHTMSNYPVWYRMIDGKLRLSRYLEWTFVSCLTVVRKPAPEAFLKTAEAIRRHPSQCLLIDDNDENCLAAEATGMQALVFQGTDDLRRELSRRGILGRYD